MAKEPESAGRGATTQHPTRRPQRIDYMVVEDGGSEAPRAREEATGTLTHTANVAVEDSVRREEEEEDEREEMEGNERNIEEEADVNAELEEGEMQETEAEAAAEQCPAEEVDGRTVVVESENFVFRVRPEEIEFEL